MRLVLDLLRHGEAVPQHPQGDALRPLAPAGGQAIRALGRRLGKEGWRPDRAFSSPLLRARLSTELVLKAAGVRLAVEPLAELLPETDPGITLEALAEAAPDAAHVLLVAHQPLLGRLAAHLTGVEAGFPAGGLVRVHCPSGAAPGQGRIVLAVPPAARG